MGEESETAVSKTGIEELKTERSQAEGFIKEGYISLLVLMVVAFLAGVGVIAYHKANSLETMAAYEARKVQAIYLADSGLAWAKANVASDPSWAGGSMDFGGGQIEVTVVTDGVHYKITARARLKETRQSRVGHFTADDHGKLIMNRYEELYQ